MESWLNPKPFLNSISELEYALEKDDPHFFREAAEGVVATRDQLFNAASSFVAAMMPKRE